MINATNQTIRLCAQPVFILVAVIVLATAALAADNRQIVSGTSVSLIPPPGFVKNSNMPVLVNTDTGSEIQVFQGEQSSLNALFSAAATIDSAKAALAKENIQVDHVRQLTTKNGSVFRLLHGKQVDGQNTYQLWIGIFPDAPAIIRTLAVETAPLADDTVMAMYSSVETNAPVSEADFFASLPFSMKVAAPIKIETVPGYGSILMTIGDRPPASPTYPILLAEYRANVIPMTSDEAVMALSDKIKKVDKVVSISEISTRKTNFAGPDGRVVEAKYTPDKGVPALFPPKRAFLYSNDKDGKRLTLLVIIPEADLENARSSIEALVSSMNFRP